uniref:ErfK/YbiS/YcfS/YnhG family protein n=1 Tax=Rhodopseudomonas palustris (strain BisA53) TaxID=316055 RepID=Q07QT2_RHOP5
MTRLVSSSAAAVGHRLLFVAALALSTTLFTASAGAQLLGYASTSAEQDPFGNEDSTLSAPGAFEDGLAPAVADRFKRSVVSYPTREAPGTVIVDTSNTYLYYVLGQNRAIRYGVGVGREGFTWSGVQTVSRKAEWPDWHPPAEMIARQPYLPRFVAGGPGNPLGARAMYLGSSMYRIHGTNDPSTIGQFVSSGCIRLTNEDVEDLFSRVNIGTRVVVLPKTAPRLEARTPERAPAASRLLPGRQANNLQVMNLSAASIY